MPKYAVTVLESKTLEFHIEAKDEQEARKTAQKALAAGVAPANSTSLDDEILDVTRL